MCEAARAAQTMSARARRWRTCSAISACETLQPRAKTPIRERATSRNRRKSVSRSVRRGLRWTAMVRSVMPGR
jgi:hypothetical protein